MSTTETGKAKPAKPSTSAIQAHDKLMQAIARIRQASSEQGKQAEAGSFGDLARAMGIDMGGI